MFFRLISLVALLQAAIPDRSSYQLTELGELNWRPQLWVGKIVRTCGRFSPTEKELLLSTKWEDASGLFVDADVDRAVSGNGICVTGRFERRDGRSQQEAEALRLPRAVYADTYNPDYVIRRPK